MENPVEYKVNKQWQPAVLLCIRSHTLEGLYGLLCMLVLRWTLEPHRIPHGCVCLSVGPSSPSGALLLIHLLV